MSPWFDTENKCECGCHKLPDGQIRHAIPCCTPCPVCYMNVKGGRIREHMARHPIHETVFSIPISMEKKCQSALDHSEAKWLALHYKDESNLARCYLELQAKVFGGTDETLDLSAVGNNAANAIAS